MSELEGPITWDSEGRIVPLSKAELERQAASMVSDALNTPTDCAPRLLTVHERSFYRWQWIVGFSRNFLQFRWFDASTVGDVRLIPVAILLALLTLPLFALALVVSLGIVFIGEAQMRRLRRRLLDVDEARVKDREELFEGRVTDKFRRKL